MSALDKYRDITYVKSFIRYEHDESVRNIYAVSLVENGEARFVFQLPSNVSRCDWYCNTDFKYNINSFCAYSGERLLQGELKENEFKQFVHSSIESIDSKELVIKCAITPNSWGEIIHDLKNEYRNRCAHIEQLIQSERDLNKCIAEKEQEIRKNIERYHSENEKLKEIEASLGFRIVSMPGKMYSFLLNTLKKQ